jgi:HK97 family phage major capsid protein
VIPEYTSAEISAHLRNYVYTTEVLKTEPGDVLNVPYVMDFDFQILAAVGDAFTGATTGLVSTVTTTLYESGGWYDLPYYLLERIDQNLLDQINNMLANASVRSEDTEIMTLVVAGTATNFANTGNTIGHLVAAALEGTYFFAKYIPDALAALLLAGKNAKPNECVLYMTPAAYGGLLKDLAANQVIAYADPSLVKTGVIERLFGVAIVVGGYRPSQQRTNAATGTLDLCYLMRGKRAVCLAPKREILIETDKQIATRALRITASHTFGVKILDFKEIVRIWTSRRA